MIKKITLFFILCCMVFSCGKKGDPKYEDSEKKTEIQNVLTIKSK